MTIQALPPTVTVYRAQGSPSSPTDPSSSMGRHAGGAVRLLRGRRGSLLIAAAVSAALNWNWLVAAGVAPVLLAILPCFAMCALGLCMNHSGRETGSSCRGDKRQASVKGQSAPGQPG